MTALADILTRELDSAGNADMTGRLLLGVLHDTRTALDIDPAIDDTEARVGGKMLSRCILAVQERYGLIGQQPARQQAGPMPPREIAMSPDEFARLSQDQPTNHE